ncbi:MAG: hypothetical protein Q7R62_02555 [bacterium]|nr:hypothetical protein [bacterium]
MPLIKRSVFVLLLALLSLATLTHAGTYFEYAPDPWRSSRLTVSTVATPYQFFQSASDFDLTGFDFWVDNTGNSGNITFTLLDDENTTLAEKTMTLPHLPAVPGGNKFHVDLNNPITISHYRAYSIQISSTLLGFGLYYANRINILEHDLAYTSEYALGVAQLGSEKQSYTFKFALEDPTENESGNNEETPVEENPVEETTPSSTEPTVTVISNARITEITGTTALAAWTTNLAADSRVTVRTQLNPLYVYTTAYDNTIELEHTLLITGLTPESGYFVDFFSQQNQDEPILTTYTVSFTTAQATAEEIAAAEEAAAAAAAAAAASSTITITPTSTTQTEQASSTPATTTTTSTSTTANLPPIIFGAGSGTDSFSVNWQTPAGGSPNGGYRIDIFDENHRLIRQLRAPADATSRNVAILPPGNHEVIVYTDNDGVFEKVGAATSFEAKKSRSPLFWFWYLMGVVLAVGIGFAFLFSRREKTELTPLE